MNTISQINTAPAVAQKHQSFHGLRSSFTEEFDTFVKKPITSDNKTLVQKLQDVIAEKLADKKSFIHCGENGMVIKIDEYWVFKVEHGKIPKIENITLHHNPKLESLKTYYGEAVAKSGNIEILRNASGEKKAIPAGLMGTFGSESEKIKYYNDVYLKKYSSLPQKAFDDVAADFKSLNEINENGHFYSFDTINPNNFIAVNDKIMIVDKLDKTTQRDSNTTAKMINVFINSMSHDTKAEFDLMAMGGRRNLLKKCLIAGEKAELPYGRTPEEREYLNDALRLCDIQENFSDIQRTMMEYRRKYTNLEERADKISQYIDDLTNPDNFFNTAHFFE